MSDELDPTVLERRLHAVTAVRRVLHAIGALARAQLPHVERTVAAASIWLDWVDDVVASLSGAAGPAQGPDPLRVVFGPERPYAGSLARQLLAALPPTGPLGIVGSRLAEVAAQEPSVRDRVIFRCAGAVAHEDVDDVARDVAAAILARSDRPAVEILAPREGGATLVRRWLLSGPGTAGPEPPQTLSPYALVLGHAVHLAVRGRLTVCAAEALHAEVRARVAAAEAAKAACDRRLDDIRSSLALARQVLITRELIEVVAGRAATLEGDARR